MLTKERLIRIMEKLEKNQFVTIKEIVEEFQISRSSAIRDLMDLENQGLIQRERGGASLKKASLTLTSFNEPTVRSKENINQEAKRIICREAAESIREGDCIFIDAGTTPIYILDYLKDKKIQLVTPNTYLIQRLPEDFKGNVYLLGGQFKNSYDISVGPLTTQMIQNFHFDRAFFSTNGMSLDSNEACVFDFQVGEVKQEVMKRCNHNSLLADKSKFGVMAMAKWAEFDEFHTIYIDEWTFDDECPENFIICKGENE